MSAIPSDSERLNIRIDGEAKRLLEAASAAVGMSLTQFIVSTCLRRAKDVIRDEEQLTLSDRDRDMFIDALDHPPAPSKTLRQAARLYVQQQSASQQGKSHGR